MFGDDEERRNEIIFWGEMGKRNGVGWLEDLDGSKLVVFVWIF